MNSDIFTVFDLFPISTNSNISIYTNLKIIYIFLYEFYDIYKVISFIPLGKYFIHTYLSRHLSKII